MAARKYTQHVAAKKVAAGNSYGVLSVDFALDETDELALSIQGPLDDGDNRVCMVLSPSEQCAYDAFEELRLTRRALLMTFTREGSRAFKVPSLRVTFSIDDRLWRKMKRVLGTICDGKTFYSSVAGQRR